MPRAAVSLSAAVAAAAFVLPTAVPAHAAPAARASVSSSAAAAIVAGRAPQSSPSAVAQRAARRAAVTRSLVTRINRERRAHGLRPLTLSRSLSTFATKHSAAMAGPRRLSHSANLTRIGHYSLIGENVAFAVSPYQAHVALLASAPHRANLLNPRYSEIGLGIVTSGGRAWVTEIFRAPRRA